MSKPDVMLDWLGKTASTGKVARGVNSDEVNRKIELARS